MGGAETTVRLVSHTHWDREWYRTFQAFRGRLVDTVDTVLERIEADPGFRFLLDGQTIVLEDYLEVRPERRKALETACAAGRIAIGPWYVQPDSLLPSGEAHVRNLLEGRRVGAAFGPVSEVAYTPDSFGHPAQFPQLFAGFGLAPFVYWRGNGNEIDALPSVYAWRAPDGSRVVAWHLARGYFSAALLPTDAEVGLRRLRRHATELAERSGQGLALLMNGIDHAPPDAHVGALAEALARETGWRVERGLLEGLADGLREPLPEHAGELVGGQIANLLPGVWSSRMGLKLRNRACETLLVRVTEPWAALGSLLGLPDDRPALRSAWRALLQNQAHDSIGGCSIDAVHARMQARYDDAEGLAAETTRRVLERLCGGDRAVPDEEAFDVAVFNPSARTRSDVVRLPIDAFPAFRPGAHGATYHPLLAADPEELGFLADGTPVRLVPGDPAGRYLLTPERGALDAEWVARDVPALGWRRVRFVRAARAHDAVDDAREIGAGDVAVRVADDGTLRVTLGDRAWSGIGAFEDVGDRGDSYDHDAVAPVVCDARLVSVERRVHPSGIACLRVERELVVPRALDETREARAPESVALPVVLEARIAPGIPRVDLRVELDNRACDHRLRLLFPSGAPVTRFRAATTFDEAERAPTRADDGGWIHPAPDTFPCQGEVAANGLRVLAPGLPEAQVRDDGTIAFTLLRAVGWLSRHDLRTRPGPAGPCLPVPGAQCPGPIAFRLALQRDAAVGNAPEHAGEVEAGLQAVFAGDDGALPEASPMLALDPPALELSAFKPAVDGDGAIVRVLNPTSGALRARLRVGVALAGVEPVRLDETRASFAVTIEVSGAEAAPGCTVALDVPAHALRSLRLRPAPAALPD